MRGRREGRDEPTGDTSDPRSGLGPDTLLRLDAYHGFTVAQARSLLRHELDREGCAEPGEDARRLVAHAIGVDPARLTLEAPRVLSREEARRLRDCERQRCDGRTVARIVGARAFHDIELRVADGVLEPRDDTGALVELALPHLRTACDRRGTARLLDVGVGAGTVALALLAAEPRAAAVGTDVNATARDLAAANALALGLTGRFAIAMEPWLGAVEDGSYDLIVSNPPYIPSAAIERLAPEARTDPPEALDGGEDGLDFYRALARDAGRFLATAGTLAVEIGAGQGPDVRAIMGAHGWRAVGAMDDLGRHERALAFARHATVGE